MPSRASRGHEKYHVRPIHYSTAVITPEVVTASFWAKPA